MSIEIARVSLGTVRDNERVSIRFGRDGFGEPVLS
jgi:hypothetical protein